jgi:uncharacterized protein YcbX
MADIRLSGITIYPVKSCAGIALDSTWLDAFGPQGDRRWMLVDGAGQFVTQRSVARLALIETALEAGRLVLSLADSRVSVPVPAADAPRRVVTVWGDTLDALDAGDAAADWLFESLGLPCRLVYMPDDAHRQVQPLYARRGETVSFADGFPLLLLSQASLDDLNTRLDHPVPMNRFRPNLVVSGCAAFDEDRWQRIRIGSLVFDVAKPCSRCVMPSIDQATGQRDPQINRVLASYRRRDGQVYFGQNLLYPEPGALSLGDTVEVLA